MASLVIATHGQRLGTEWGAEKISRNKFSNDLFRKKILFHAHKFLMTLLSSNCTFVFLCCLKSKVQ